MGGKPAAPAGQNHEPAIPEAKASPPRRTRRGKPPPVAAEPQDVVASPPEPAATPPDVAGPPAQAADPPKPPRRGWRRRTLVTAGLATLLVVIVGASAAVAAGNAGRVMPGVRVGGIALSGLTRDQAEERLRDGLPSLTTGSATVVVDGVPTVVPYEEIGRGYEWDAMLDAAFAVARDGNLLSDGVARLLALIGPTDLPVLVHGYEPEAIDRVVADLAERFARPAIGASATYDPDAGFSVEAGTVGRRLDTATVRQALGDAMANSDPADVTVTLETEPVEPRVTTVLAQEAVNDARAMSESALALVNEDGSPAALTADDLAGAIVFGPGRGSSYEARADLTRLRAKLAPHADLFRADPRNASFTFDADGVAGVVPAEDGRSMNLTLTGLAVIDALDRRAAGASVSTVEPVYDLVPALLSTEAAEAAAPNMTRLSTWSTYYVPGPGNAYGANISIPAEDIDGLVLAPGEWFDFWKRIGPVTVERGYGYGGAIIGGRSVSNGVLAGGICSTSTTLFNTAMRAGLEIGERYNHSYYIARYPVGLDATVFATDTWAASMTFRNDTPDPIVIRTYTSSGVVRFDIWGVQAGRTVTLSAPIITNRVAARETTRYNPSLPPGTSVRIEGAYSGFDASVTRTVRDADGNTIHVDTWFSHYIVVNGITEVGPSLPPPPTPAPTPTQEPLPSPSG